VVLRRDFAGKEAASAAGAEHALYVTLPQGRRVVLTAGAPRELEGWRVDLQAAAAGASADAGACRPLPCAPAVVKARHRPREPPPFASGASALPRTATAGARAAEARARAQERALEGVPDCFRGIVWHKLSGADALCRKYPARYGDLLQCASRDDARIERDVARTMPSIDFFKSAGRAGQLLLFNVAHACAPAPSAPVRAVRRAAR